MAKADAKAKEKVAKEKKERAPKEYHMDLHNRGNEGIKQSVQHIRAHGVILTTVAVDSKGNPVGGPSTVFLAGLKPKSKNGERFLVIDKGPKPKKEKGEKKEKKK